MQRCFPRREATNQQIREIQARVAEIGVCFLFENFPYKFSGENYQQMGGGPIGARVTMAAARIVMSDWGEKWRCILEGARTLIGMLDGFVDDVGQQSTCLRYGTRWDDDKKSFKISEDAKQEDLCLRREMHETSNARMVRVCIPANSINRDLEFTAEIPEEFQDNKLPILDFFLWQIWLAEPLLLPEEHENSAGHHGTVSHEQQPEVQHLVLRDDQEAFKYQP